MNTRNTLFALLLLPTVGACAAGGADGQPVGSELDDSAGESGGDAESGGNEESEESGDAETGNAATTGELPATADTGEEQETDGGETETDPEPGTTDTGDTEDEPPFGDGDSTDLPAVRAQFRVTAGGPVSVVGPLFNDEPIDTRGLQYEDAIAAGGDETDHLAFNIVPGEVDPTIRVRMECDVSSVRAEIRDEAGGLLGTALCNEEEQAILLTDASSLDEYRVVIFDGVDQDVGAIAYSVSINAFCFQQCAYAPYMP
jgi:hypothetical protein